MITEKIQLFKDNPYSNLLTYVLDAQISSKVRKKRPAIIICPGGSYLFTATKEGEPVAFRFLAKGYHTFVLRYRTYYKERVTDVNQTPSINETAHYPEHVYDLMESIRIIKENAEEWCIDTENIFVLGFSAGAHVAASLGVKWDDDELLKRFDNEVNSTLFKPKGILLCYPLLNIQGLIDNLEKNTDPIIKQQANVINQAVFGIPNPTKAQIDNAKIINCLRDDMPPVFLWHTYDDQITSAKDSAELVSELIRHNVHCEFHMFAQGKHGMALCDETSSSTLSDINKECAEWVKLADNWMKLQINENKE